MVLDTYRFNPFPQFRIRRRSRERRSPVSEIVTDTPTICQRDTGQRGRSAMDTPRHEGTPYLIEVTSRPGKYVLLYLDLIYKLIFEEIFMAREKKERKREKTRNSAKQFICPREFKSGIFENEINILKKSAFL